MDQATIPSTLCRERLARIQGVLNQNAGVLTVRDFARSFSVWEWELEQAAALGWIQIETRKPRTGRPSRIAKDESTLPDTATAADIKGRKTLLNILLNSPDSTAAKNCVWRSLRRRFPLCLSIIDSIKRDDHRAISRQFQHFTAAAITSALQAMQGQGLPAIPDTDALIVRQRDRAAACHAIGRAMFRETRGVCVTVDGIRFRR